MANSPVTAIILGAGHRSMAYAKYAQEHPEEIQIVGIAELDEFRRNTVRDMFNIPENHVFESAEALAQAPKFADAVINGTMDEQHVETAIPLLEKGYDMLLEKPFAVNEDELDALMKTVNEHNNKVMICHVLRYNKVYLTVKNLIVEGKIGDVINIQTVEDVSYHHLSTSFVRGKWGNTKNCHTSMLLAKCCHDLDIMAWLMGEDKPVSVSSVGTRFQFREENAPKNAGTRCLADCPLVDSCRYSAKRLYLDHPNNWEVYIWRDIEHIAEPTYEDYKNSLLKSDYGKCIYKCGNDVVDHQSVLVKFKSGATGTHNLTGGCAESVRTLRVIGTKGEIYAEMENKFVTLKVINPTPTTYFDEETFDLSYVSDEGHGGGDTGLMADFVKFIKGEEPSVSCTSVHNSVAGHKIIFRADKSNENGGQVISLED